MSRLTPFADAALAATALPPAATAVGAAMPRSDAGEPPRAGGRGIAMHGIGKRFGAAEVLRDVDLHIAPGEFCVFVGPSGCGKSTLLRIVAGLESASSGRLAFDGRDVGDLPPADRDVAMVFQSYALYPHMDVRENLSFGLRHRRLPRGEIEARVGRAAAMLGLEPLLGRRPRELSGGQRQRVAIGRAIVREPSVFLFDEPLSNLDAALRARTRIEIARLHREIGGASMVYVTHDQVEAMTLADRIVLLRPLADAAPGTPSIAQSGRPMDLYLRPANRFVAGFIGSPAMNFVPARVHAAGGGEVVVDVLGTRLALRAAAGAARPGDALTMGVRPEHLSLGAVDDADRTTDAGSAPGPLATVLHVEQFGDHAVAHVRPDAEDDPVLLARCAGPVPGGRVRLCWAPGTLHLFDADGLALVRP